MIKKCLNTKNTIGDGMFSFKQRVLREWNQSAG